MKKPISLLVLAIGFGLAAIPGARATDPASVIDNFHEVSGHLYRGARPSDEGLKALAEYGVKTTLSLDDADGANRHEVKVATALGMKALVIPMSSILPPSDSKTAKIQAILNDPALRPLYVHCLHGQDRTGLMVGLYRVFSEGWTPARAYEEMEEYGFHRILLPLYWYYKKKTGYDD
jgi:protein tyrosine/serine phosphatase